jgi:F-type H+-transporting ATPase subunit gamma
MPSLIDIRRRIRAVKSTQQITKAMKMISASKLRRAKERVISSRPFAQQMARVLNNLAARVDPSTHPLLAEPEPRADARTLLIVVTADKGLCGGFNTNVIKAASGFIAATGASEIELGLVGRKGRDFFRRRGFEVLIEEIGIFQKVRYADAQRIAQAAIEAFTSGHVQSVSIVYNEFKSVMQQRVVIARLLPIPRGELEGAGATGDANVAAAFGAPRGARAGGSGGSREESDVEYLYEPDPAKIFAELLPRHVEIQIYRALVESAAAEHAARMTAMDAATKNSGEIIESLTLYMNKVRQAAITREIIEVVSGAQSTS